MARNDTRKQLKELLDSDPSLLADLRAMVAGGDSTDADAEDAEPRSHVFEGILEDATFTQTRKSLKYDGKIAVISPKGAEAEAIVVVYLPPEVATDEIIVSVVADGMAAEGREVKARRRRSA